MGRRNLMENSDTMLLYSMCMAAQYLSVVYGPLEQFQVLRYHVRSFKWYQFHSTILINNHHIECMLEQSTPEIVSGAIYDPPLPFALFEGTQSLIGGVAANIPCLPCQM